MPYLKRDLAALDMGLSTAAGHLASLGFGKSSSSLQHKSAEVSVDVALARFEP